MGQSKTWFFKINWRTCQISGPTKAAFCFLDTQLFICYGFWEKEGKKMHKTSVGQLRLTDSAGKIFEKAFDLGDLKEALTLIASLVGKPIAEICKVTKYSSKNGKPEKFKYVPYETWDGKLWLGGIFNNPAMTKESRLHELVLEKLKVGDAVQVGDVVIRFVPDISDGDSYSGGTTPKHLEFE